MKKLKKLSLNKETIVNLNDHEMNQIHGGGTTTNPCWAISGYITGKIADRIYDWYMKSKKPDVYVNGWLSKDYNDGICGISDVEVIC